MGQSVPLSNQRVMDIRVGLQDAPSKFECTFLGNVLCKIFHSWQ